MSTRVQSWSFVTALAAMSCGGARLEAGLANAPSIQRQTRPRAPGDAIANGPESCPEAKALDPLPHRIPPCQEPPGAAAVPVR